MKQRGGFPGGGFGGGGGNMQQLLKQAQKMQADMAAAQEEIASLSAQHTAGGMVTAVVSGEKRLTELTINPDALDDAEMLQDMVMLAVNGALEKMDEMSEERMNKVTGGVMPF